MNLTVVAVAAGLVLGLLAGGRPRHLASHRFRWWVLLVPGFGLQVAADRILHGPAAYLAMLLGPTCLLVVLARNALLVGVGVVAVGVAANLAVLAVDDGMPVQHRAMVEAGIVSPGAHLFTVAGHRHHLQGPTDHLVVLDDRIPIRPEHQVVSIGDLILAVGVADVVFHLLRPPSGRRRVGRRRTPPPNRTGRRGAAGGSVVLAARLEVPVEGVEDRPGVGLGGAGAVGQPPTTLTGEGVAQHDEAARAELGRQVVDGLDHEGGGIPQLFQGAQHL
jgi:hypothetical protein